MLVTWKYRPRNTFIQRLDPRTRLIFLFAIILALTIPEIWDYRIIFPLFLLSLTLFLMARIEWKDVRRPLIYVFFLVFFIVGLNAIFFGRGGPSSVQDPTSPVLFSTVTVSKTWFAIVQITRMLTMAILAIPIAYTVDPNIYGTAFKRMGISDKVSFTMDLAFRFLPTFARDFAITLDAQRARGYELEKLKGGLIARIQRLAPRSWLKELHYAPRDYFMLGLGAAIFIACCVLKWGFGIGGFFVPEWFTRLIT
jgi:energy-coupling factor transport system permease protein